MNDTFHDGLTREEILIGRITDGEASANDWSELERLASTDAGVLRRLAEAQRIHAGLEQAVEDRIAICELIEARAFARPRVGFVDRIGTIGGWAAAAVLGVILWNVMNAPATTTNPSTPLVNNATQPSPEVGVPSTGDPGTQYVGFDGYEPDEIFSGYLERGRHQNQVVGVMPDEVITVRTSANGQHEVIMVRRIVERRMFDNLQQMSPAYDETGRPIWQTEPLPKSTTPGRM